MRYLLIVLGAIDSVTGSVVDVRFPADFPRDRQLEAVRQTGRVARQKAITSELLELIAGRQAALPGSSEKGTPT